MGKLIFTVGEKYGLGGGLEGKIKPFFNLYVDLISEQINTLYGIIYGEIFIPVLFLPLLPSLSVGKFKSW